MVLDSPGQHDEVASDPHPLMLYQSFDASKCTAEKSFVTRIRLSKQTTPLSYYYSVHGS